MLVRVIEYNLNQRGYVKSRKVVYVSNIKIPNNKEYIMTIYLPYTNILNHIYNSTYRKYTTISGRINVTRAIAHLATHTCISIKPPSTDHEATINIQLRLPWRYTSITGMFPALNCLLHRTNCIK
jgi:hypothetical protein